MDKSVAMMNQGKLVSIIKNHVVASHCPLRINLLSVCFKLTNHHQLQVLNVFYEKSSLRSETAKKSAGQYWLVRTVPMTF